MAFTKIPYDAQDPYSVEYTDAQGKTLGVIGQPQNPNLSAAEMQQSVEAVVREVMIPAHNTLIDDLLDAGVELLVRSPEDSGLRWLRLNSDRALETSEDGENWQATASSGHRITDAQGTIYPQRSRLKFLNTVVSDNGQETVVSGIKGDTGAEGPKGDTGSQGPRGETGATGPVVVPAVDSNGVMSFTIQTTAIAPQPVSVRGPQGPQGVQGAQGQTGPQGIQGVQGVPGIQGPKGNQGDQGPAGAQGPQGVQGPAGEQGPEGKQGPAGPAGKDGTSLQIEDSYPTLAKLKEAFPAGDDGMYFVEENGECYIWSGSRNDWTSVGALQGAQGPAGPQGAQGVQGPAGKIASVRAVTGEAGSAAAVTNEGTEQQAELVFTIPRGDAGPQGIQGPQGVQGVQGPQGVQGAAGTDGKSAYQTAVESGYAGTETAFNEALAQAPAHIEAKDNPHDVTKAQIGLDKVENERQYSASNPPPYPVGTVNGKTGNVSLGASDVGAAAADHTHTAAQVGALPATGGTVTGALGVTGTLTVQGTAGVGNPPPQTAAVRNISAGTDDLEAGVSPLASGQLYFVYE